MLAHASLENAEFYCFYKDLRALLLGHGWHVARHAGHMAGHSGHMAGHAGHMAGHARHTNRFFVTSHDKMSSPIGLLIN